jgi:hypothetical protein
MELKHKLVRVPDIDEFPSMRVIAVRIMDAYLSLDFEPLFAMLAHDVVYRSDISGVEIVGIKTVSVHFRKKAVKLRKKNSMIFAVPVVLSDRIRPWKPRSVSITGIYAYHHGEPAVKLGYDNYRLDTVILRFTLDSKGLIKTLILGANEFADENLENYCEYNMFDYFDISIRRVIRELMNDGHIIKGVDRTMIIDVVSIKNNQEYFTSTSIARFPYTPDYSKRHFDTFRKVCLECNAVGQLARVQLRMDNEYPWRIQYKSELVIDLKFEKLEVSNDQIE